MILEGIIQDTPTPRSNLNWSVQQEDIFQELKSGTKSLCIEAVAGSGKTTTILEGMNYIPKGKRNVFVAFNKSIADELSTKVPSHVQAKTLHALCYAVIRDNAPKTVKLVKTKNSDMLKAHLSELGIQDDFFYSIKKDVDTILKLLKANYLGPITEKDVLNLAETSGMVLESNVEFIILSLWDLLHEDDNSFWDTMDFDDMLRVPLMRGYPFPKYDNVFVDEAQDLNLIQHTIIKNLLAPGGRVIAVGDSHQAIYAFRGAKSDSMELLRNTFRMESFPLSTTYRCPITIVETAKLFNPSLRAKEGADAGHLSVLKTNCFNYRDFSTSVSHMILCRRNAPLVKVAMTLVKRQVPIHLMGRNLVWLILETTKKIIHTHGSISQYNIEQWRRAASEGLKTGQIRVITDLTDVIQLCREELGKDASVKEVERLLYKLFPREAPEGFHIKLCTIHKSKGLEADGVYILQPQLLPFYSTPDADTVTQQEENLHYVAITRSKYALYYVDDDLDIRNDLFIPRYKN